MSLDENCCDHFEDFIQNMENCYGDEVLMDEEILEALYENPFHHQEEMVTSIFPENETDQHPDAGSYDLSSDFEDNFPQSCHMLSHQEKEQER